MGFIIFVAVVILAIYLIKKSSSDKNSSFEEPVKSQISFDNLSQEDLNDRDEKFRDLMQGRNGEELTKCYNKCKSLFIPKEDGRFAGSFSGVLSETYRAKKLAETNEIVTRIFGNDLPEYAVWYAVLFDNILNEMYFSKNGKLVQFVEMVIADVWQGDALLKQIDIDDILSGPDSENKSTKVWTEKATIKIEKKLKNGKLHYEIKGAYDSFKYGLCMDDDLIRKAEILITICAKYEYGPKYELHKDDVEKYALPSLSR